MRIRSLPLVILASIILLSPSSFGQSHLSGVKGAVVALARVSIEKLSAPNPVTAGQDLTYTITASNEGPDDAASVVLTDNLPSGTTFASLSSPGGWSCTTPAAGSNGTVTCSIPLFTPGSAVFTPVVHTDPTLANGSTISNTVTITSTTFDDGLNDNTATNVTNVESHSDLGVTKGAAPSPVTAGTNLTYTIGYSSSGPSAAANVTIADPLPSGTTFASVTAAGWSCTTPAIGVNGTVSCSIASLAPGASGSITIVVSVDPALPAGTTLSNTATISGDVIDSNSVNDSATKAVTTTSSANLGVTKSASPNPVKAGSPLVYTIGYSSAGPSTAANVTLTDALPAGTTFSSISAPGWSCTTPAVGANGTVSCMMASLASGASGTITLTVLVSSNVASGTVSNTATIASSGSTDPVVANNSATATVSVIGINNIPATSAPTLLLLGAALILSALLLLRK